MTRPTIDPALGLDLVAERTLTGREARVSVLIPAHDEAKTIGEVVAEARRGLELLGAPGEVVVSASGCTDDTAALARAAGAEIVHAPLDKGAALAAALPRLTGDVVCLVDGDIQYFGHEPVVALLVRPILDGLADVCVTDLFWRPVYPQLWSHGFFTPLAGLLFPEILAKVGSTPWSGQRAAVRQLWPSTWPDDFTVDLALLLHWNDHALRMRPVLADEWTNPQRPKPDLLEQEFQVLVDHAVRSGRLAATSTTALVAWFDAVYARMATYHPDHDDPQRFERQLLEMSLAELRARVR